MVLRGAAAQDEVGRPLDRLLGRRRDHIAISKADAAVKLAICLGKRPSVAAEPGRRQREAIMLWWKGDGAARPHLGKLSMPVLVGNGIADVMVPAEHSFAIAQRAKLLLYPDAGHAFLFQYAEDFCAEVQRFLSHDR